MKKIIAMLLVAVMAVSMAACGAAEAESTTTAPVETTVDTTPAQTEGTEPVETEGTEPVETTPVVADNAASAVLNAAWALYAEDQKFFAMGGDYNAPVDGAAGPVTAEDHMTASLIVPETELANIAEAAALMHAMNANTFTGAAYKLVEGADATAFVTAMQTAIQGNQWMCGFPETLLIVNVDGIIVVAFGHGDAMTPFQTNLTAAYANAEILVNEAIGG